MVNYVCNKCKKMFNLKGDYKRHINKKYPCANKNSKKEIDEEKKIETEKEIEEETKTKNIMQKLEEKLDMLIKSNEELSQKVNVMEEELKKIKNENIVVNVNNTINNTINIVCFGKEDTNFLSQDNIKEILLAGMSSIPKYIKLVHCNDDKPEYKNIYISNSRDKNGSIYVCVNGKWELKSKDVIDFLRTKGMHFVYAKYNNYNDDDKTICKKIELAGNKLKDKIDKDDSNDLKKKLTDDIKIALFNNRPKK